MGKRKGGHTTRQIFAAENDNQKRKGMLRKKGKGTSEETTVFFPFSAQVGGGGPARAEKPNQNMTLRGRKGEFCKGSDRWVSWNLLNRLRKIRKSSSARNTPATKLSISWKTRKGNGSVWKRNAVLGAVGASLGKDECRWKEANLSYGPDPPLRAAASRGKWRELESVKGNPDITKPGGSKTPTLLVSKNAAAGGSRVTDNRTDHIPEKQTDLEKGK